MRVDTPRRVLLIEDHRDIAELVYEHLEHQGYAVDYAADGVTGLRLATSEDFDVIILDLMLPGLDGLELCRRLRQQAKRDTPIVMATARDTLEDKIAGLDAGADDYVVKPFELAELEARLRAVVRRYRGEVRPETLQIADLTLDTGSWQVRRGDKTLTVPPISLKILTALMRASPRVVTRRQLEQEVWGDIVPDSDALRSHVYNLRKVVDRPFGTPLIHTIQNIGYRAGADDST